MAETPPPPTAASTPRAADLLEVLRQVVVERHGPAAAAIEARARLDEDLGLNSLERVELCLRLERDCGVSLPIEAVGQATTVGDLVAMAGGGAWAARQPGMRFPEATPWRPPDTPRRSRLFTAYVALLLAGVTVTARLRLATRRGTGAREVLQRAARTLVRLSRTSLRVEGLHHLRGVEPAVIVSNHQSYLDTAVLLAALPLHPAFVANERLPGAPLLGTAIAAAGYVVVDRASPGRPEEAVSRLTAALERGETLVVFPEGTLAPGPDLLPFRLGAFAAAVAARRPVVPVSLRGTRQMLPYDTRVLGRAPLSVVVHPPIAPAGGGWREVLRLAGEAERRISAAPGG